jgi:hypothetical protein
VASGFQKMTTITKKPFKTKKTLKTQKKNRNIAQKNLQKMPIVFPSIDIQI